MTARLAPLAGILAGVLVTLTTTSCAGAQDEAAGSAAHDFLAAVGAEDGASACELLAPAARAELEDASGKSCARAVLEEDVEGGHADASRPSVQVYDSMAQVRVGTETLFLSRFDGDWLVVAAACSPRPGDQPYDCSIEVG